MSKKIFLSALTVFCALPAAAQFPPMPDMSRVETKAIHSEALNADEIRKAQLLSVKWFVDCGDDDFLLDRNIEFTQAMRAAQIPCEFRVRDGGHTWEY